MDQREAAGRIGERQRDDGGDQHHPRDGPDAKQHQVADRPHGIPYGGQHQQRDRRGSGQPVDHAYHQRTHRLVEAQPPEDAVDS